MAGQSSNQPYLVSFASLVMCFLLLMSMNNELTKPKCWKIKHSQKERDSYEGSRYTYVCLHIILVWKKDTLCVV